eukprot:204997_1
MLRMLESSGVCFGASLPKWFAPDPALSCQSQQQESPSDPNKNQPKSRKNKKRIVREYETDPDLQEIENNSSTYEVDENLNNMNYTNHGMTRRTRSKKVRYNTDEQYSWIDKLQ